MKASQIVDWVQANAGHPLFRDEGLEFGSLESDVKGITVCWMPDSDAIEFAIAHGHNLIVHHESLFFSPPPFTFYTELGDQHLAWKCNKVRPQLLAANEISALRIHGTADELFVYEAFRTQIGLPVHHLQEKDSMFRRIYHIEPIEYGSLLEHIKKSTGMSLVRHTGTDYRRIVTKVAIPWGGMGLSINDVYLAGLMELGDIDVMIAGETDNYAVRMCRQVGIDVIETGHEISETVGIDRFADALIKEFPGVPMKVYTNPPIFKIS